MDGGKGKGKGENSQEERGIKATRSGMAPECVRFFLFLAARVLLAQVSFVRVDTLAVVRLRARDIKSHMWAEP